MSDNGKQDSPSSPVRAAAVQMNSGDNVNRNLELAARLLGEAAADGCALAVLPENFPFMGARGAVFPKGLIHSIFPPLRGKYYK